MGEQKRIGINLAFDNSSNSGIVNYIYNIIAALKTLPVEKQPFILLLYSKNAPVDYILSIGYPRLKKIPFCNDPTNLVFKKVNLLILKFSGTNLYKYWKYYRKFDVLYPYFELMDHALADFPNKIHWLVDFNNRIFPEHYADMGESMRIFQECLTQRNDKIVLSSHTLKSELIHFYPEYKNDVKILPFASTISMYDAPDDVTLKKKFNIGEVFFMSPNQFWQHKNQIVLIEAVSILRNKGIVIPFKVVFTGSQQVNRGKDAYAGVLLKKIEEYGLRDYIVFTGVLDRVEQLILMRSSLALIQPSLYEGWSTLVEEAKAMNKFILLSDLPVHREQICRNVAFFEPNDALKLALLMEKELYEPSLISFNNYDHNIKKFGDDIINVLY
jgi:glycosyltransferase involved in cell wall biosynthesis